MSANIHPTAVVDPAARIDSTVTIGPYSVVGPDVEIGAGTQVGPHCVIDGVTTIGRDNRFYRFCSIGGMPQDKKYAGEPTRLVIGDRNTVREFTTFNTGTVQDGGLTTIGNDNWIMAYVHVAHDCHIGNNTILANSVQLGGHVHVGDWAIVGGLTGVHQFSKIGAHSMTGGNSSLMQDTPPYVLSAGNPCRPVGINVEGLKRRGFSPASISALREAYKILYRRGLALEEARAELRARQQAEPEAAEALQVMLDFLDVSSRGIIRP
ncbi:acyl-ACP--UDP-N-acetylglucosamine O-acyltransferase [Bordetella avium]|uniref:Acyl-[acyl-carrier-protein]--UDP-N-acetylglucosamine O-acyltransferase n=1 Tax=Bordetella avium (strain 197N) TaxID=360910 RepID=Q2L148_BORA1|nr:acyl-ACP--UDP-N-acetylglucosamine O-acyltransferase [Bordetella avium]AZY49120.1 acyl-ACP--UDP-N-acetylglucosamine O-acyltransferase [Bordetella avium]AZY52478.1 acyl-ACP--UDP-N-acetylglucosamine O-acyltransferase [Bordetella avium]RIQ12271.1 acyl-ACP--UDP-N-acetylglucosamine O-acyltransferase [Bordetella avium]RIQ19357.1 acyl-ACP--UDP-N-acetylglucosamine O-acyltransferase [Bordetella avium]RIQ33526.1 acyl-ACP--UDP-N-acetylglucosamine O-acyltransferase [Bordetella avium]